MLELSEILPVRDGKYLRRFDFFWLGGGGRGGGVINKYNKNHPGSKYNTRIKENLNNQITSK